MRQLNYHHLKYFYTIATEGSVSAAAEFLSVTPQTVSGQLATFEQNIGTRLFIRNGKAMQLSELGKKTMDYAESIFKIGSELTRTLENKDLGIETSFKVGIVDAIPKVMAFDLLDPCFSALESVKVECHESDLQTLLGKLSLNRLDLIISDQPMPMNVSVKANSQFLGQSGLTFFASKPLKEKYAEDFPNSLNGAPMLFPSNKSAQQTNLLSWFDLSNITPKVVAEFDDTALLKFFGQAGRGVFCTSTCIETDILNQFDVEVVGRINTLNDRYYAIYVKRRKEHPCFRIVLEEAKKVFRSPD